MWSTQTDGFWPLVDRETWAPWHWHPIIQVGTYLIHTDALNHCCHRPRSERPACPLKMEWIKAEITALLPDISWEHSDSLGKGALSQELGHPECSRCSQLKRHKTKAGFAPRFSEKLESDRLRASSCCWGRCQIPQGLKPDTSGPLARTVPPCVTSQFYNLTAGGESEIVQLCVMRRLRATESFFRVVRKCEMIQIVTTTEPCCLMRPLRTSKIQLLRLSQRSVIDINSKEWRMLRDWQTIMSGCTLIHSEKRKETKIGRQPVNVFLKIQYC